MTSNIYVFNQYFLTFIKTVKKSAKSIKERNSTAREILKKINAFYSSFDNKSTEYIENFKLVFTDFIIDPLIELKDIDEWIETNNNLNILNNISIKNVKTVLKKNITIHNFLLIFHLFKNDDLSEEDIKVIMEKLKGTIDIEDKNIPEKYLKLVNKICEINMEEKTGFSMGDIEDTSIGKLAKEIVEEVNLDKVKESINSEGDILSALSNPDNGIGNLISDVSQKMASKLKNGEIKQDALLKDALSMAGKLPGMNGGGGGGGEPDLGNIMKMMSGLIGGGGGGGVPGKARSMQRKMDQKSRMKKKLDEKNKSK